MIPVKKRIAAFVALMGTVKLPYNEEGKRIFHTQGRKVLEAIAVMLGLQKGSYDVRSNKGGIAVAGEVTLHGERIYVQFSGMTDGFGVPVFMYRFCKGRTDYSGGINRRFHYAMLENDLNEVIKEIKNIMERGE